MKKYRTYILAIILIILMSIGKAISQDTTGVRSMIIAYDIKHSDIVMRQLCFESGYLGCNACSWSNNSNPFGFIWKGKYLDFDNLEHAISYYKWWQDKLYDGGDYYTFLENIGYATYPFYVRELKKMW